MNLRRVVIGFVVLLTVSSAAVVAAPGADPAHAASAQSDATLTVHVVDDIGDDVQGATVTATWDGGETSSDTLPNGEAGLAVPRNTELEITVAHDAYVRNSPVTLTVEDAEHEIQVGVAGKAEARLTVTDDGSPVEDARVAMWKRGQEDNATIEGRTDADGIFESGTVEVGTYTVLAVKAGYLENRTTVEVAGATESTLELEGETVTVEVTVEDDHFDEARPVESARVEFEGPTSTTVSTGGNGEGTVGLPVNAEYAVTVTKDGYATTTRQVSIGEERKSLRFTVNRADALHVETVNQRIVVGENVQVEVTDEYGETVEGATVRVDGEAVGETNADGVYRAAIDSAGNHTIAVERDGTSSGEVTVEGVSTGGGSTPTDDVTSSTATETVTETTTGTEVAPELPDIGQPSTAVQIGAAVVGVLLAFLVVRRLL